MEISRVGKLPQTLTSSRAAIVNRPYPTSSGTCVEFFCFTQALSFFR
jgi:hypothetical protein